MKYSKPKKSLVEFLGSNNLVCLVMLVCAFGPLYLLRTQDAERIESVETQVETQANTPDAPDAATAVIADQIKINRQPLAANSIVEAKAAKAGITDRQYELISGYCTRFARQVVEANHGKSYAEYFGGTAKVTANNFLDSRYGHLYHDGDVIQPGDLLFKRFGSGGYGHVGVYVGDVPGLGKNLVAENSSTSIGRIQGAKGYRTLDQFGDFDVLVRLPLPEGHSTETAAVTARLIVGYQIQSGIRYQAVKNATLKNGRWRADSATLLATIDRKAPTSQNVIVVDYLKANKITPYKYGQHLNDKKNPRTYLFIGRPS